MNSGKVGYNRGMKNNRPYLTITEIAERWKKNPTSVRRAIDSRHKPLIGYKSPDTEHGIWLILEESVRARWGDSSMPHV